MLAAALREGHTGPVFLQADHDQVNAAAYARDKAGEIARLERIMREQIAASYFNIDIDASTVVDLSHATTEEQQRLNAELTAHFSEFVRRHEPEGVTISLGAEIGEVGHHNTTPAELRAFMATYPAALRRLGKGRHGVSKISVNSGTYHGGKVLPDGTLAPVNVDYATLTAISDICRREFRMAGAVQHGASTLPRAQLARFPASGAVEIHLALGFNNLISDHPGLPTAVSEEIRDYTFKHHAAERAAGENDRQFLYNTRKKSWKVMKQRFWDLPEPVQSEIMGSLKAMFTDMFRDMNVAATRDLVATHTRAHQVPIAVPADASEAARRATLLSRLGRIGRSFGRIAAAAGGGLDNSWNAMTSLSRRFRAELLAYSFLWPSLLILFALLVYPLISVVRLSFYESNLQKETWVGLANYQTLLVDPLFWRAFLHTVLFTVFSVLLHFVIGLGLALLLNARINLTFRSLARGILIVPWLLAPTVAGMIWVLMLAPFGIVNAMLAGVGLVDQNANIA